MNYNNNDQLMKMEIEDDKYMKMEIEDDKCIKMEIEDDQLMKMEIEDDEWMKMEIEDDKCIKMEIEDDKYLKMEIEDDQFIQKIDNNELYQIKKDLNLIKQYLNINTNKKIHPNIQCSYCFQYNFTGIRYKCMTCYNFNLCEKCEKNITNNHNYNHLFIRIHDSEIYKNSFVNNYFKNKI